METRKLDTAIYEKDGPVAWITLNYPEKANIQSSGLVFDVDECLDDLEKHGFHVTDAHVRITESVL